MMSYTIPSGNPEGIPLDEVGLLRQALIAEIIAINEYRLHIAYSPIKELNEIWCHIMNEEKTHFGLFLELIREFDPEQMEMYIKVKDTIKIDNTRLPTTSLMPPTTYLNLVREDIKGENEAILLYDNNTSKIQNTQILDVYNYVIREEKKHIELLTEAMLQYNGQSYGPIYK